MTTEANGRQATSACNGATTNFGVPFQFIANADLQVFLLDAADEANEDGALLVQGVDYTITGVGRAGTASVVTTATYPAGKYLRRFRVTSKAQSADYVPNDGFAAEGHEVQLDRLSLIDEEQADDIAGEAVAREDLEARALRFPEAVAEMAAVAARKGKFLKFNDATGEPEPAAIVGTQGDPGPQGIPGAQGISGVQGDPGPPPTLTFGAVTTGLAGSNASVNVVNLGLGAYRLDFTLPRGAAGASGALGDGDYGDATVTGGGLTITIKPGVVTLAKMANLAGAGLLGGTGAGAVGLVSFATIKTQLALNNVDNTSDANKPVSTATQTALNAKAPLASPALTGAPTSPTAASGTATTQIATTAFVDRLRDIATNPTSGAYILQLSDRGKTVVIDTNAQVPPNSGTGSVAFPLGSFVELYNSTDADKTVTFTGGTDVFRKHGATANVTTLTLPARSLGQLRKVASLTEWLAVGFS